MTTSNEFKTHDELDADSDFIQYLEHLLSGTLDIGTGINRPLGRLGRNTDALLDALQASRNMVITGGGTLSWVHGTGVFQWTGSLIFNFPHELGSAKANVVVPSTVNLNASGAIAYVKLDRQADGPVVMATVINMAAFIALITANADRLDYQIVAFRDGNNLRLIDGRSIVSTYTLASNGIVDTQYGQQTEVTLVHDNQKQNLVLILTGGGNITYDSSANTVEWDADLYVRMPHDAGSNVVAATTLAINAGQVGYISLTRAPAGDVPKVITVVNDGAVPDTDDNYIILYRDADDDRVYFRDGTALSDGETVLLGGTRAGVQFFFEAEGTGVIPGGHEIEFGTSVSYQIGSRELMVYRNGKKARGSSAYWLAVTGGGAPAPYDGTVPGGGGGSLVGGPFDSDDEYIEEDVGDGTGHRVIWLKDGQTGVEALFHPAATHDPAWTWPDTEDYLEAFVGTRGIGPSPVEGIRKLGETVVLEGIVNLEEGANVTITRNDGNNSFEIAASITAGVNSIKEPDVENIQRTGNLEIKSGNKITVDNTTSPQVFQIDSDVDNIDDLDDVTSDMKDAFVGATLPSASNVLATMGELSPLIGFDVVHMHDDNEVRTNGGLLIIGGVQYRALAQNIRWILGTTAFAGGESYAGSGWYYLYLGAGASPGDAPIPYLSTSPPVLGGTHPTEDLRFVSSARIVGASIGSAYFTPFVKSGSQVVLGAELDLTMPTVPSITWTSADFSADLPASGIRAVKFSVHLKVVSLGTDPNVDLRVRPTGTGGGYIAKFVPINVALDLWSTIDFEVPIIGSTPSVDFYRDSEIELQEMHLLGYTEGVLTV